MPQLAPSHRAKVPHPSPDLGSSLNAGMLQNWLKFQSAHSSTLWAIYATAMSLMFVARFSYVLPSGLETNLIPEEYFNFKVPLNNTLLVTHLASVLPAGLLAVFQFVPCVRHRFVGWHRTVGTIVNLLTVVSTLSACGVSRVSFGGDLSIQLGGYVVGTMTLFSMFASWRAIRRQRIDEHRRWIIRSWSYQMSVVTLRLILVPSMLIIGWTGNHFMAMSCAEVENSLKDSVEFARNYPECSVDWTGRPVTHVAIEAGLDRSLVQAAGFRAAFGMSIWVAFWLHAVGAEYYIFKTKESGSLRDVSSKSYSPRSNALKTETGDTQ